METTIANPVLTNAQATGVQAPVRQSRRNRQATRTQESQPKSNIAAVSTPVVPNYLAIAKECAGRKVAEGESYVSRKGKSHLKALCCAAVASQLGLSKEQAKDLGSVEGGEQHLKHIDTAIVSLFSQLGANIATEYDRLTVRTQFAYDRVKERKSESGATVKTYEFGLAATMRGERDTKDVSETRRTLNTLLAKHKKRMDYMLEHKDDVHPSTGVAPRFTTIQLRNQSALIGCVEAELAKLPEFQGAVMPDEPRDVSEHYRNQQGK